MAKNMSKAMIWSVVGVLVIIAIVIVIVKKDKGDEYANTPPTGQTGTTPPSSSTPAGNLAYNEALKKYGTNRIQFNDACQSVPNNVTYKSGTQVMFDNRSAASHTVTFNGGKHTIAGYGYTVISMTASKYPATVLIDCDKSQNVATVLIQK